MRLSALMALASHGLTPLLVAQAPTTVGNPTTIAARTDGQYFMNPEWAPAGRVLAFTSAGYRGIWVFDMESGRTSKLNDEPAFGFGFSWAQDGSAIMGRVARFDGPRRLNGIRVIDAVSGDSELILPFETGLVGIPTWLGNQSQAAVYRNGVLSRLDIPGRVPKGPTTPDPVLLPVGDRIVRAEFDTQSELTVVAEEDGFVLNLTHSPDRRRIAFEVLGGDLWIMGADGSDAVSLGQGNRPGWSPDSRWIVFQRSEDDGHEITASDLFASSLDGTEVVQLTSTADALEMNPSWSSDGKYIAFDDRGAIYVLRVIYE